MRSIKDSELVDLTEPSPTIEAKAPNSEDTENPLEDPSCILKMEVAMNFSAVIVKFMAKKTDNPVIKAMNTLWDHRQDINSPRSASSLPVEG